MQVPAGGEFVWETMRMQTTSLADLFLNPIAQIGFAHTVIAGYTTAAVFVVGISAFYLLRKRDIAFAKRSMAVGLGFGIVASLMVMLMGDQQGILAYKYQPMKLAAIEGEWNTQTPPANWTAIAFPSQDEQKNYVDVQIPDVLGLLVTHSYDTKVYGIKTILFDGYISSDGEKIPAMTTQITNGAQSYEALLKMRTGDHSESTKELYNKYKNDIGFAMLLDGYMPQGEPFTNATEAQVHQAALSAVPNVLITFWSFRVMVGLGVLMFFMFIVGIFFALRGSLWKKRWMLRFMLYLIPAPWIAAECGWIVTEHGRQPWTVYNILPTSFSASTLNAWDVLATLVIFILFYAALISVEMYLMFKFARKGPSALHTNKYHFEKQNNQSSKAKDKQS